MDIDTVVRALRICNNPKGHRCSECPVFSCYKHGVCKATVDRAAADLIDSLTAQLAESQRREKAAVEDINLLEDCGVCKHHDLDSCDLAGTKCYFEWRGPQAEKGEAE